MFINVHGYLCSLSSTARFISVVLEKTQMLFVFLTEKRWYECDTQEQLSSLKFLVKEIRLKARESQEDSCLVARSLSYFLTRWQVQTSEAGTCRMPQSLTWGWLSTSRSSQRREPGSILNRCLICTYWLSLEITVSFISSSLFYASFCLLKRPKRQTACRRKKENSHIHVWNEKL